MEDARKRLIPAWLWAALAVVVVGLVLLLAVTDRRQEPSASYTFDVTSYAKIDPKDVTFEETKRIALNVVDPSALALGPDGKIYVAGENVVAIFDGEGNEAARYAVNGRPDCLAVTPDGKILLGMRSHIEVLDAQGASVAIWQDLGERACLTAIAADEQDVFAADAGNRVVLRFDLAGNLRNRIGERDADRKSPGLIVPSPYLDVALDPQGALWVVNPGRHGLENYRPNGELVSSWYRAGMDVPGFCGCCNPIHIAFRNDGSVVTAEKGLNRIKVYAPDTTLLGVVATPENLLASGTTSLSFDEDPPVADLAVDRQNRILVLHKPQKAIRIFEQNALSAENGTGKV